MPRAKTIGTPGSTRASWSTANRKAPLPTGTTTSMPNSAIRVVEVLDQSGGAVTAGKALDVESFLIELDRRCRLLDRPAQRLRELQHRLRLRTLLIEQENARRLPGALRDGTGRPSTQRERDSREDESSCRQHGGGATRSCNVPPTVSGSTSRSCRSYTVASSGRSDRPVDPEHQSYRSVTAGEPGSCWSGLRRKAIPTLPQRAFSKLRTLNTCSSTASDCAGALGSACRIARFVRLVHGDRQLLRDMIRPRWLRRQDAPSMNRSNAACCVSTSA